MSAPALGERWATGLHCSTTGEKLPLDQPAFLSSVGKPLLVDYHLDAAVGRSWQEALALRSWDMWRYRELLPIADISNRVALGEGGTPLVRLRRSAPDGVTVWLKQEAGNPTGSFKDRGLSMAVSRASELGAPGVELPSAGNAAISLAAYAADAGMAARVALPTDTPVAVRRRCEAYGAEVLEGGANLTESAGLLTAEPSGFWNLSTLKEPYRAEGKKTMGLEIVEQLGWALPDWIVYPTGGGTGIVGMHKAFAELDALGLVTGTRPRFVAVQMEGCAPIVRAWEAGGAEAPAWEAPDTRVWGLRVPMAIGDFLVLKALYETDGCALRVPEEEVEAACQALARDEGLLTGPEGGAAWLAVRELERRGQLRSGQSVVVFQTGHPANYSES